MAEGITEDLKRLTVRDKSETEITLCNWNIMGTARAEMRMKVTTATFEHPFRSDGTSLGQSDIICIQEMTFKPSNYERAKKYFPFSSNYGVLFSEEPGSSNKCNAIYYNKDKFSEASIDVLENVYESLEFKRICYERINKGGYDQITKATKGRPVVHADCQKDEHRQRAHEEVLAECRTAGSIQIFDQYMAKFRTIPGSEETKATKTSLTHRMAIGVLKVKPMQNYYVVVVSIHNYSKKYPKERANYATLFFEFMAKLRCSLPKHFSIIIVGDFNFDLSRKFIPHKSSFFVPSYDVKALRSDLDVPMIDFVVVDGALEPHVRDTQAHDLQIPSNVREVIGQTINDERTITNHSPLSTIITLNQSTPGGPVSKDTS